MKKTAHSPAEHSAARPVGGARVGWIVVAGLAATALFAPPAATQDPDYYDGDYGYDDGGGAYEARELTARVWLDRGDDPVLERGDRARLYYRASEDAFVAVFHIDTNGTTRLLFPRSPEENHYVRGGRDYRLVFPGSSSWIVSDDPGVGYFFAVASLEPFDFRDFGYSPYSGGWDLSYVGRRNYGDPYVAMDEFVALLIPDWEYAYYALDFSSYHVDQRYEYPRFLCYDCHGFRPYATWNPYLASCTSFRVVVYRDPYYYPATRYRGVQVVYARPLQPGLPRFEFKERARGESAAPLAVQRTPSNTPAPRATPRREGPAPGGAVAPRTSDPGGRAPTVGRSRPSERLPNSGVTPPPVAGRGAAPATPTRPTLQRRPTPASAGSQPPPARSGGASPPATRSGGGGATPPVPVRRGGGGGDPASPAVRPTTTGSPGSAGRAVPTRSGGGTASPPASARSGGGTASPPASARSGRGTASSPAPARSGAGTARTPARSGGGAASPAPTARSGSGSVRPPTRSGGGAVRPPTGSTGGSARPPTRSGGGGASPPPTRRGGGGLG